MKAFATGLHQDLHLTSVGLIYAKSRLFDKIAG